MTRVAVLSADLVANSTRFESGLSRANRAMASSRQQWQSSIDRANRSFAGLEMSVGRGTSALLGMQGAIKGVAAAAIGGFSVQSIVRYSDAFTNLYTQLGNFTQSAGEQRKVFNDLYAAAQRTGTGIQGLAQTYSRLSGSLPDILARSYDLVDVTELLARGFSAAGATTATTEGALLQLSQGLATNFKVAGQELNSFIEGAPVLAKLIAKQLGGESAVDLKRFATEGKLTAQTFLDALIKSRAAIEQFEVPETVGRSLERVRNSLIKMVGESTTLQTGARGLADSIDYLAGNIDTVVRLGAAFAVIMGGRMLSSLLAVAAAQTASAVAAARQTAALQAATIAAASNVRMQQALTTAATAATGSMAAQTIFVGQTGKAVVASATAMQTAAVAARGLGTALLAMVGGPIGAGLLAIAATVLLLRNNTSAAKEAQNDFNTAITKAQEINEQLNPQLEERARLMRQEREEALASARATLERTRAYLEEAKALTVGNALLVARTGLQPSEINASRIEEYAQTISEMEEKLAKVETAASTAGAPGLSAGGGGGGSDQKNKIEEIIKALQRENQALGRQIDLYGAKASALDVANKRAELANQIADTGTKMTAKQREEAERLLDIYEEQTVRLEQQKDATEAAKEAEEDRKRTLDSMFSNFNSKLEDALINGGKLGDVLSGVVEDFTRALIRANITSPLVDAAKSSGLFSGLGDLFRGSLPSFAVGSNNVPYDMTANIHKGEMIIPAREAAAIRAGGGGGAVVPVNIQIVNNNGSRVSSSASQDGNGTSIKVMIDQATSANISDRNSLTAQALEARGSRTLNRRG